MRRVVWVTCVALAGVSSVAAQELKLRATLRGHADGVSAVAFSPEGRTLASGSDDGTIRLWDVAGTRTIATLSLAPPAVARNVLADRSSATARTKWLIRTVYSVAFSPDGKTLASGHCNRGRAILWDVATRRTLATLHHPESVECVAFSPDGKILASASYHKTIKLWDVASHKEVRTLKGEDSFHSVAFSPDGALLASGG